MNGNSDLSREGSAHAGGRLLPHWRMLFIALMLAATLGGRSESVQAQDTSLAVFAESGITASIPPDICVGQTGSVKVQIDRILKLAGQDAMMRYYRLGVAITGESGDSSVASLHQTELVTGLDLEVPGKVEFDYSGDHAGTTQLTFTTKGISWLKGEKGAGYGGVSNELSIKVKVKVINCKYKVTTISTWNAGMDILATIDDGMMEGDASGNLTGTADVHWVTSMIGGGSCAAGETRVADSKADLTGKIDESGQLTLTVAYGPTNAAGWAKCKVAPTTSNNATFAPVTITIPESGGVSLQSQTVTAKKGGAFPGLVRIVAIPIESGK